MDPLNLNIFPAFCSEETIEESKLKFSEDEETLIIRMYNLVGERLDSLLLLQFFLFYPLGFLARHFVRHFVLSRKF